MSNLKFLQNIMHNGIIFKGSQAAQKNDVGLVTKPAQPPMVVDLETDVRGLKAVAQSLIERGAAETTTDPATHSANFVNAAQEALPLGTKGSAPTADAVKQNQEALKARLQGSQPVTQAQMAQPQPAASQEAPVQPQAQPAAESTAPTADANAQPSPEEVAAAAGTQS